MQMMGSGVALSTLQARAQRANELSPVYPVSVFSKNLQWLTIQDMAAFSKEVGFDGIDLTVRENGHINPSEVTNALPEAVKTIRKNGLQVFTITTSITDAGPVAEAIIKTAASAGVGVYRMGWMDYDDSLSMEKNLRTIAARMSRLAKLNRKYNIIGDYQNHSGKMFGAATWDLREVLKAVDATYVGCQFDIRHAAMESTNAWPNALRAISRYIHSLDLKDFQWQIAGGKSTPVNVPLGEGIVDFPRYFQQLKALNIVAPMSIHFEYPLGGAENGDKTISISQEKIFHAMKSDLEKVRSWVDEYLQ
jgi:L-ribulose-5-phosphate 3-epimerase